MTAEITLRPAVSREDLEVCAAIWLEASRSGHDFIAPAFWKERLGDMLEIYLPGSAVTLALLDGVPAGFSAVNGDCLAALFTLPEFQGRGVGTTLLRALFAGHDKLDLSVYSRNIRARRFYEHMGFRSGQAGRCAHTGEEEMAMPWSVREREKGFRRG